MAVTHVQKTLLWKPSEKSQELGLFRRHSCLPYSCSFWCRTPPSRKQAPEPVSLWRVESHLLQVYGRACLAIPLPLTARNHSVRKRESSWKAPIQQLSGPHSLQPNIRWAPDSRLLLGGSGRWEAEDRKSFMKADSRNLSRCVDLLVV